MRAHRALYTLIAAMLLAGAWTYCAAQAGDWQREELGTTTRPAQLRAMDGTYVAQFFDGFYSFNEIDRSWVFLGKETEEMGSLNYLTPHPDGSVLVNAGLWARTLDVRTGELGPILMETVTALVGDTVYGVAEWSRKGGDSAVWYGTWKRVGTSDVVWRDSIGIHTGSSSGLPGMFVSDTSMLIMSHTVAVRLPFGRSASYVILPDTVGPLPPSIWIDAHSSHILVQGRHSWMYSVDDGRSWQSILPTAERRVRKAAATHDPDVVLILADSLLGRYHLSSGITDTLLGPDHYSTFMEFADGPLGVMASTRLGMVLIAADGTVALVGDGLPTASANTLLASTDGLLASTYDLKISRLEGGLWRVAPLYYDRMFGGSGPVTPMNLQGSRSVRDFWLIRDPWVSHVVGDDAVPLENLMVPNGGVYVPPHASYVTCIATFNDSPQIVWWSGSSPIRILFTDPDLRYVVAFGDSVLVAFTKNGKIYRTVNGQADQWELRGSLDVDPVSYFAEADVKGRHALVRIGSGTMVTHDSGATWTNIELTRPGVPTITDQGVILLAEFLGPETRGDLVVKHYHDGQWYQLSRLSRDLFDRGTDRINDVAYDDVGKRLYIATNNWVRSVGITITSVSNDAVNEVTTTDPLGRSGTRIRHGVYDLLGRHVCETPDEINGAGAYIVVTEEGTVLRVY